MHGYSSSRRWAFGRVGEYMQIWSLTEGHLDKVLSAALKLDPVTGIIVTAEMLVHIKVKIALAAVDISFLSKAEKKFYSHSLNEFL